MDGQDYNDVKVESPRWIFDLRLIVQFFPFPLRPQRSQTKNQQTYNFDSIKKEPNPQPINRATEDVATTERRIAIYRTCKGERGRQTIRRDWT